MCVSSRHQELTRCIKGVSVGFVKGQSGNPKGRPPETESRRAVKKLIQNELDQIGKAAFQDKLKHVEEALATEGYLDWTPAMYCLLKEIAKGNTKALELLMDRIVGRPTQIVEEVSADKTVNIVYNVEK